MISVLITIVHVIVCFVLIGVILLQAGRGQGLTGASFSGNVQSLFGTKGSLFLQKATTVAAVFFVMTCLTLSIIESHKSKSLLEVGRTSAPIDIDQIQKALEQVKSQTAGQDQGVPDAVPVDPVERAGEAVIAGEEPQPVLPLDPNAPGQLTEPELRGESTEQVEGQDPQVFGPAPNPAQTEEPKAA